MYSKIPQAFIEAWPRQIECSTSDEAGRGLRNQFYRVGLPRVEFVQRVAIAKEGNKVGSAWCPFTFTRSSNLASSKRTYRRVKEACEAADVVAIDIDKDGLSRRMLRRRLEANGWTGIIVPSFSDGVTQSHFQEKEWLAFCEAKSNVTDADFLLMKELPANVAQGAHVLRDKDGHPLRKRVLTDAGKVVFHITIEHAPWPKSRVIIPLSKPFLFSDYPTHREACVEWAATCRMVADALEVRADESCFSPEHYFFDPRHAHGKTPEPPLFVRGRSLDRAALTKRYSDGILPDTVRPQRSFEAHSKPNPFLRDQAIDYEAIRSAVLAITNDERFSSRNEWIKVAGAIHHAASGSSEGLEIFQLWSGTWTGDNDPAENERVWASMQDERLNAATAATLVYLAKRDGWTPPGWMEAPIEFRNVRDSETRDLRSRSSLRFYYPAQLKELREASYLVRGWLFQGQLSAIYGQPGAGKTFFAIDVALSIALGQAWFGRKVKRGAVIYVALEGVSGIRKRAEAWCKFHGESLEAIPMVFATGSMDLLRNDKELFERLAQEVQRARERFRLPVSVIFIDTLARAMAGGDENSSQDMGALISAVDKIRGLTDSHVCLVHHEGKDSTKGMRGSSALLGAVDTAISIGARKSTTGIIEARLTKQKEDEGHRRLLFSLQAVMLDRRDGDGELISSAVVVPADNIPSLDDSRVNDRDRAALKILSGLISEEFQDEDDKECSHRIWVPLAKWKRALLDGGWMPVAASGSTSSRTHPSGSVTLSNGRFQDMQRTTATFDRTFHRVRERLRDKGYIEIVDGSVTLRDIRCGQSPDRHRTKHQDATDNRTPP